MMSRHVVGKYVHAESIVDKGSMYSGCTCTVKSMKSHIRLGKFDELERDAVPRGVRGIIAAIVIGAVA